MTGSVKRRLLIFFGLALVATVLIAASLSQLQLQPGIPLPDFQNGNVLITAEDAQKPVAIQVSEFVKFLFVLLLAASMLYVTGKLLKGTRWKDLMTFIKPVMIISLAAAGLLFLALLLLPRGGALVPPEMPMPTAMPAATLPLGSPPNGLVWLVGFALLASGLLLGLRVFGSPRPAATLDLLGLEAQRARQALNSGAELKDVIVHCYRQMGLVVAQERGLEREEFMTTGDFEKLLEASGLPREPLRQLTRLFEAVRYGNWRPNPADEEQAIQCLDAISASSQTARKAG